MKLIFFLYRFWAAKNHDAHWDLPRQQQGPLFPWRGKRGPEETEEEEAEQGVVAYLVCPVVVF